MKDFPDQRMDPDHGNGRGAACVPGRGDPPGPPEPPAGAGKGRGFDLMTRLDSGFRRLDRLVERSLPPQLNPLALTGAIANTFFLIACVTGVLLLIWYRPTVDAAYDSLEEACFLGTLMRSAHRYSSDACVLFMLIHVVRVFVARKYSGARSLAWVTGIGLAVLVWVLGWTGYWLVWDERAAQVAWMTARVADVLPIFAEPLSRAFLVYENLSSTFFFLVLFAHMLIPLAVATLIWLHLARLSRPKLLTNKVMTLWLTGATLLLSLLYPATSAPKADMAVLPGESTMDVWYLFPLLIGERVGGGILLLLFFGVTLVACSVPWTLRPRRRQHAGPGYRLADKALVDSTACEACTLCSRDCPFDAISMVPRPGVSPDLPRIKREMALVDAARCVGCGVCIGACDSDAINMGEINAQEVRRQLEDWVREDQAVDHAAWIAFVCGRTFRFIQPDPATGRTSELPGFRVVPVPCVGWVSAPLLEKTLQAGANGILLAGCGGGETFAREGVDWLEQRIRGKRPPVLSQRQKYPDRVRLETFATPAPAKLAMAAEKFQRENRPVSPRNRFKAWMTGILLTLILGGVVWRGSDMPYTPPYAQPQWIVSLRHQGAPLQEQVERTQEELERLPVHMRGQPSLRGGRAPVRLRIHLDGELWHEAAYPAGGLRGTGPSVALERFELPPGRYQARVEIGDTADSEEWPHVWEQTFELDERTRRVLLFDGAEGFHLH